MPRAVLQPILITLVVGIVAVFGYWAQAPWLVPNVGASAFIQLLLPEQPAGQAYDTGVGQLVGMVAGFASGVATTIWASFGVVAATIGLVTVRAEIARLMLRSVGR